MIDTAFCRYGGFRKHRIPIGGNLLHKYVGVLCQNNHSFRKKDSGEDISPRRMVQDRHGAEHVSFSYKLGYSVISRNYCRYCKS